MNKNIKRKITIIIVMVISVLIIIGAIKTIASKNTNNVTNEHINKIDDDFKTTDVIKEEVKVLSINNKTLKYIGDKYGGYLLADNDVKVKFERYIRITDKDENDMSYTFLINDKQEYYFDAKGIRLIGIKDKQWMKQIDGRPVLSLNDGESDGNITWV